MRCSACGDVWFQTPPPDVDDAEFHPAPGSPPPGLPAPGAARLNVAPGARPAAAHGPAPSVVRSVWNERPGRAFATAPAATVGAGLSGLRRLKPPRLLPRWRGAVGWLVLAAIITVPVGGALLFRTDIVNAWPKAARIYSALGIPVTSNGLLIHADYSAVLRDGRRLIEVRGEIENQGGLARPVPALQLALYDAEQRELYRWVVPVNRMPLDPKGRRAFRTTFPAPGKDVRVQIRFTEDE